MVTDYYKNLNFNKSDFYIHSINQLNSPQFMLGNEALQYIEEAFLLSLPAALLTSIRLSNHIIRMMNFFNLVVHGRAW